ncbi:MAG: glutamine-hydrolyzing carbamoyl-phosphate synthase small subunit, partial [Blastocatellia bacterium]|nr:glutamine-hydrolyzing carbamoyl-phosphate synthase small subunit [Blastocatellia bacterium]
YGFGATGETTGEVVFNTSITGYQEILTDPSYAEQIVVMTYPEIGNYGTNSCDNESKRPFAQGLVVRNYCYRPSNWQSEKTLSDYLSENGVVAIEGIDTRKLVRHIRNNGAMRAIIYSGSSGQEKTIDQLLEKVRQSPKMLGRALAHEVSCKESYTCGEHQQQPHIVAFDFGIKQNILNSLLLQDFRVSVVPSDTSFEDVEKLSPDGIFLSNGPGDPEPLVSVANTVTKLIHKYPTFGICLGHQILALAVGAKTYKLKFGHRGANHPVKNLLTGKVEITSQNHGFAVDIDSLPKDDVEITHVSLNDQTLEGMRHRHLPVFSVQYHPEASPGPHDASYLFEQFRRLVDLNTPTSKALESQEKSAAKRAE